MREFYEKLDRAAEQSQRTRKNVFAHTQTNCHKCVCTLQKGNKKTPTHLLSGKRNKTFADIDDISL